MLKLSLMTAAGEHVSAVYFGDVEAGKQYYSEKYGQTEVDAALRGRADAIRDVGVTIRKSMYIREWRVSSSSFATINRTWRVDQKE